ncbi:MAG TPA: hypothetical protein VGB30_12060 [bacterium]
MRINAIIRLAALSISTVLILFSLGCNKTAQDTNKPVIIQGFSMFLDGDEVTPASTLQMEPGSTLSIRVDYTDPDAGEDPDPNWYSFTWAVERVGGGVSEFNPNSYFIVMEENPCIWTAPDVTGYYRFIVEVRDRYYSPSQETVVVEVNTNKQPVINSVEIVDVPPAPFVNQEVKFIVTASDPDGNLPLEYQWKATGGYFTSESEGEATWLSPVSGAFTVTVIVSDQASGVVSREIPIVVQDNHAPVINGWDIDPGTSVSAGQNVTITLDVTDADNDQLEYNWSADAGSFSNVNQHVAVWSAPGSAVNATINVTVEDNKGGEDSAEIVIVVN